MFGSKVLMNLGGIGILVSKTDNVIHYSTLGKTSKCWLYFYDQDLAHCLVKQAWDHLWLTKTLPNI